MAGISMGGTACTTPITGRGTVQPKRSLFLTTGRKLRLADWGLTLRMVRGTKSSNIRARALKHGKNRGKRHQRQSPSIDEGGSWAALVIWSGQQLGQSRTATAIARTWRWGAT